MFKIKEKGNNNNESIFQISEILLSTIQVINNNSEF